MTVRNGSPGSEGARTATGEAGEQGLERGRFSARRKMAAVMRLLRGRGYGPGVTRAGGRGPKPHACGLGGDVSRVVTQSNESRPVHHTPQVSQNVDTAGTAYEDE